MKKILTKFFIAIIVIGFFLHFYIFQMNGFHNKRLTKHFDSLLAESGYGIDALHNIGIYKTPENFEYLRYEEGFVGGPQKIALGIFGRNTLQEYLILFKVPLHLVVKPEMVSIEKKPIQRMKFVTAQRIWDEIVLWKQKNWYLAVHYYIPFFWTYEANIDNQSLILRGIDHKGYNEIETDKVNAYIWYGDFEEINFDKKPDSFRKYVIPSLFFKGDKKTGAVALVKDKKTGATIFAIRANDTKIPVDKAEFEEFLKTIDFETEIYDPMVKIQERAKKNGFEVTTHIQ